MSSLNDIYNDFFGDLKNLQKENQKKLDDLNKTLYGTNGILSDENSVIGSTSNLNYVNNSLEGTFSAANGAGKKPVSEEDALAHAQDALADAKNLIGSQPIATANSAEVPKKKEEPEQDPEEQLDELIGLKDIKHDVKELAAFAKVQKMRKDEGMKSVPVSLHLVFTGNPGTGKTTVARILGKLYNKIGILSKGQLVEVDRSGLVAGYLGQTAIKVQEVIERAKGGVLFIDEAYSLAQENDSFGQEAIDTLLKAMEDYRDDLIVIVAGYTEPMEYFINSNPGLKSRFNKYIEFPDYTVDELEQIFYLNCRKYDYVVEKKAKERIREMITERKMSKIIDFANGREVRNMFEDIITNQARRIANMKDPKKEDLRKIILADLVDNPDAEKDEKDGKDEKDEKKKGGKDEKDEKKKGGKDGKKENVTEESGKDGTKEAEDPAAEKAGEAEAEDGSDEEPEEAKAEEHADAEKENTEAENASDEEM